MRKRCNNRILQISAWVTINQSLTKFDMLVSALIRVKRIKSGYRARALIQL